MDLILRSGGRKRNSLWGVEWGSDIMFKYIYWNKITFCGKKISHNNLQKASV